MQLKEMDESLALAEVDAAVAGNKNIVFFCYTPHHMFALHDLVILKEPKHDPAKWNVKQPTDGADWLEGQILIDLFLSVEPMLFVTVR